jgi:hypothetical protein
MYGNSPRLCQIKQGGRGISGWPRLSRGELTPFGKRGSAVLFEDVSAVEVTLVVEVVMERGMDGGKFLQGV